MGLGKKMLKGAWNATTMDNLTPATGGGLTSAVITKQINARGFLAFSAIGGAIGIGKEALAAANRRKLGQITYQDGMTQMTNSFTTGLVPAMMKASKGDYQAFSGMAENVMKSHGLAKIDDYGANAAMISALYNMGGR